MSSMALDRASRKPVASRSNSPYGAPSRAPNVVSSQRGEEQRVRALVAEDVGALDEQREVDLRGWIHSVSVLSVRLVWAALSVSRTRLAWVTKPAGRSAPLRLRAKARNPSHRLSLNRESVRLRNGGWSFLTCRIRGMWSLAFGFRHCD